MDVAPPSVEEFDRTLRKKLLNFIRRIDWLDIEVQFAGFVDGKVSNFF